MKNFGDYTYFIYIGNNKSYGFTAYNDPKTGQKKGYVIGYNGTTPIYKKWRFNNDSMRIIRVGKDEVDLTGQNAIEFLRGYPECAGSTAGAYTSDGVQLLVYFKEMNEDRDAKNAVETRKLSIEAQNAALKLKGEELLDFAAIIGIFDASEDVMTHRVLDFASNFPQKMLDYVNDPSRKIKALVERAINAKVFSVDGRQVKWEGKIIGADKEEAVSNLLKDDKLRKAIELNLSKFGG